MRKDPVASFYTSAVYTESAINDETVESYPRLDDRRKLQQRAAAKNGERKKNVGKLWPQLSRSLLVPRAETMNRSWEPAQLNVRHIPKLRNA